MDTKIIVGIFALVAAIIMLAVFPKLTILTVVVTGTVLIARKDLRDKALLSWR